eukprot:GHVU01112041.1.p2 GENE.GHVU01112041.1~~GHVU01112041.1.p2  ORF type:complete len:212 (+),score=13.53 GHVU01112041.1:1405-2040(+)
MFGNNILQCNSDGQWIGEHPRCEMVTCGTPPIIKYASVTIKRHTYGGKAKYECNKGYILQGDSILECMANRTWMYKKPPNCVPVDCGPPPEPEHGRAKYAETILGNIARYFCNEGYVTDKAVLQCADTGSWNDSVPNCIPVKCPTIMTSAAMIVVGADVTYGNQVQYSCMPGYALLGDSVRTCTKDGQWTGSDPQCISKYIVINKYYKLNY